MKYLNLGFRNEYINIQFFNQLREKWPQLNDKTYIKAEYGYTVQINSIVDTPMKSEPEYYTHFKKGFKNYIKRIIGSIIDAHSLIYQGMGIYYKPIKTNETVLQMEVFRVRVYDEIKELICVYHYVTDTLYIKR